MFETQNLYQNDPAWKNVQLGHHNSETIGSWGCLLTSMTMVANGAGYSETPATLNEKLKANGGFQGALVIPAVLPYLFPKVSFRGFEPCESQPAPIGRIDSALAAGKPVIVQVDWNPDAGIQTHWVVLKEKKGDDYVMYDPYRYRGDGPDKELLLTERYKYQGTNVAQAISGVVWYEISGATVKPPKKKKVPVPKEKFMVYASEDDLAFRADPMLSGYLYKRLLSRTPLISLEPKEEAKGKLGVVGQWLHVQDPEEQQGYVAAWYLMADLDSIEEEETPTTTTTETSPAPKIKTTETDLVLASTATQLTLRHKPVIAEETVIRWISDGEQFVAIEPADEAEAKIGVQGEWIEVRTATGEEGFVAAWYVKAIRIPKKVSKKTQDEDDEPKSPPTSGMLRVRTTAEAVALRSQPIISDATLIKRLREGEELQVIDDDAESKIGVTNQWLKVRDGKGSEGYIAAWYVER